MFNRGRQDVSETVLADDLRTLEDLASTMHKKHQPSDLAHIVNHRLAFTNISRGITEGSAQTRTFTFDHSTLRDYLVARETSSIVRNLSADQSGRPLVPRSTIRIDSTQFNALLSFTPFISRASVVEFLRHSMSGLPRSERDSTTEMLLRSFRHTLDRKLPLAFDAYNPRHSTASTRLATYSANLLTLIVCTTGGIAAEDLYGDDADEAARKWHVHKDLWSSQLPHGWQNPADVYERQPSDDANADRRLYIDLLAVEASDA